MKTAVKSPVFRLEIIKDDNPINPRENDNLGTMICFHTRYSLGDKHDYHDKDEFLMSLLEDQIGDTEKAESKYEELAEKVSRDDYKLHGSYSKAVDDEVFSFLEQKHIILPLFLYDHSGITIRTTDFGDRWDSGQVGWIYVNHDKLKSDLNIGNVTPEVVQHIEEALKTEVYEYDCYLRGECYRYKLFENDVEIDSCYGFLGDVEDVKKQVTESLPEEAKSFAETEVLDNENIDSESELEM
jgi:hypothetical protein